MSTQGDPDQPAQAVVPLRQGVTRAALTSGAVESISRILTVVLSIAAARTLQPTEVGLLGLAVILIGIVSLISACSETAGVITRGKGSNAQHAFVAFVTRGAVTATLLVVLRLALGFLARLLVEKEIAGSELSTVIAVLMWQPVVEVVATYPKVLLQRELNLTYVTFATLAQVVTHVGLSLVALLMGYGVVGVAWASVIASTVNAGVLWVRLIGRLRSRLDGIPSLELWRQSLLNNSKVFAGGFIGYLNGRIDNLLVSSALGPTLMSYYAMAWNASRTPALAMQQTLGFVLVPTLASIQQETDRIERALRESLKYSYLLLAPACAIMFVCAPSLVEVVLGSKWLPLVPCLRLMSVTVLAVPILSKTNALLVASGRAHIVGIATTGHLLVLVAAIIPLARQWGIAGAAVADFLGVAVLTTVLLLVTPFFRKILARGFRSFVLAPIGAALIGGSVAWLALASVPVGALRLTAQALLLLGGYGITLSLLGGRAALADLLTLLREVVLRLSMVPAAHP